MEAIEIESNARNLNIDDGWKFSKSWIFSPLLMNLLSLSPFIFFVAHLFSLYIFIILLFNIIIINSQAP